jgi:hypothetical protein
LRAFDHTIFTRILIRAALEVELVARAWCKRRRGLLEGRRGLLEDRRGLLEAHCDWQEVWIGGQVEVYDEVLCSMSEDDFNRLLPGCA